ncbi:transcription termination/antitermination NusG family protein [Pantoea ananatis]|uniref:transcription termination/antitermination NusG family protein n=1 Tax=Pantoea ananas TaxID=553 RepID=UPI001B303B54|nr:transcription termination/antitermination NusG family protein [Pantoea ananatis]
MADDDNPADKLREPDWFVVKTKAHSEFSAQERLESRGVKCWVPSIPPATAHTLRRQAHAKRNGKNYHGEPLFPGYLFACFDPEVTHTTVVKSTPGVSGLVTFGDCLAKLSDDEIEALKKKTNATVKSLPASELKAGAEVEFIAGPFEDFTGIYQEADGEKRSVILINLIGNVVRRSHCNRTFRFL